MNRQKCTWCSRVVYIRGRFCSTKCTEASYTARKIAVARKHSSGSKGVDGRRTYTSQDFTEHLGDDYWKQLIAKQEEMMRRRSIPLPYPTQ